MVKQMQKIRETLKSFENKGIDKATFIQAMHERHHAALFDYADYLASTNIRKIEIESGRVVMTSRDRGIRIVCAPKDFRIAPIETLNFSDYEKDESAMMENLVMENDAFFDIGANIGWYSLNIAASRRNAQIFAFEPIPKTFAQLQVNVALNLMSNISIHNFGFSNLSGNVDFFYYPEGSGNASYANVTERSDVETVTCQLKTLDEYIASSKQRIDFIKCDVEGAELFVFEGGIKAIGENLPVIFSEILRKWSAKFNYNPNQIFDLLSGLGYHPFTVKGCHLATFGRMDEATLETNFFFLHKEKHGDLIRRYLIPG